MKKKISIIMAVYNSENYLSKTIKSVLNQSFKYFEFIIINDGSNDNSRKIINKFKKDDKRIILIDNKENIGLTKSLNKGIKIASGKYIARIDSDDISLPDRLKIQYTFLEKNPKYFLIGGNIIIIDGKDEIIKKERKIINERKLCKFLENKNTISHSTIMFRNKNIYYRYKS
jgi:glycosyltransferase involved in cell wall biosynthesis